MAVAFSRLILSLENYTYVPSWSCPFVLSCPACVVRLHLYTRVFNTYPERCMCKRYSFCLVEWMNFQGDFRLVKIDGWSFSHIYALFCFVFCHRYRFVLFRIFSLMFIWLRFISMKTNCVFHISWSNRARIARLASCISDPLCLAGV